MLRQTHFVQYDFIFFSLYQVSVGNGFFLELFLTEMCAKPHISFFVTKIILPHLADILD